MTVSAQKYAYQISYLSPRGALGSFTAHFAAPLTSQDFPELTGWPTSTAVPTPS